MQSEQQDSNLQGGQRNASRNDSHLPECRCAKHHHAPEPWCDCDRIRACEQRVREQWYEVQSETWEQGYRHGLDKAREAVAKIPKEDGGYCHVLHACDVDDAIDALLTTDMQTTRPTKAKPADLHDPQWGEMIH